MTTDLPVTLKYDWLGANLFWIILIPVLIILTMIFWRPEVMRIINYLRKRINMKGKK